jgi:circadian clock protein KaiC
MNAPNDPTPTRTILAATGIEGLDHILLGGLPSGRTYLVKGHPGVGKTTLAVQFLLAGAAVGETGLYITLSETMEELRGVARSHGWSLDALSLYELQPRDAEDRTEAQYTMYQPAEVELDEAMQSLLAEVERVKPARVVFDSLSEIRLLAQDPLRYRRQVLALKRHFAGKQCTVLLLDDHSAEMDSHLESLAHGVIALERHAPLYGGARRRLEIAKLRGARFRDGFHDFTIEPGGLRVYPRLVAAEHKPGFVRKQFASGVKELDELLGGGLERGTATLVIGPAGSGKSALATHYALAAAREQEHAAIFTFDETIDTFFARGEALGLDVRGPVDSGRLRVVQVDPAEMPPGRFAHEVRMAVERDRAAVIVIDSLTGYLNSMPEERFLLNQLHELLTFLGQQGVVTILVATQHGLIGSSIVSPIDVSYLADGVILLRYFEATGTVRNAISVVKKRSGPHERTLRELKLGRGGIQIGEPLHEFHGVLTGTPTYSGAVGPLLGESSGARA